MLKGVPEGIVAVLKDGRVYCGPMWQWGWAEGWFTLVLDPKHHPELKEDEFPYRIYLRDCVSAVDKQQRTNARALEDVDLFERARQDGWKGQ